jgi:hypothetical protein
VLRSPISRQRNGVRSVLLVGSLLLAACALPVDSPSNAADGGAPSEQSSPADWTVGETLEQRLEGGFVVTSRVMHTGDILTELKATREASLLAKGWWSRTDRVWAYVVLDRLGGEPSNAEAFTIPMPDVPELSELNERLVAEWRAPTGEGEYVGALVPYAPGCHYFTQEINAPNEKLDGCLQDCCAMQQAVDKFLYCDLVPSVPSMKLVGWLEYFLGLSVLPSCTMNIAALASCITMCGTGLTPPASKYSSCAPGTHRCYDDRCAPANSTARGTMYCRADCLREPSPCDPKVAGQNEWCTGGAHECNTGDLRRGYWAADCDTAVASCECDQDAGEFRCVDKSCPAGASGYCGKVLSTGDPGEFVLVAASGQRCDPHDVDNNPCCGKPGMPCCDGECVANYGCSMGDVCVPTCGQHGGTCCSTPGLPACAVAGDGCDDATRTCKTCGKVAGQPCCDDPAGRSFGKCIVEGLGCDGNTEEQGTCVDCGGPGETCCDVGEACEAWSQCAGYSNGHSNCERCGTKNNHCCTDSQGEYFCKSGLTCKHVNGFGPACLDTAAPAHPDFRLAGGIPPQGTLCANGAVVSVSNAGAPTTANVQVDLDWTDATGDGNWAFVWCDFGANPSGCTWVISGCGVGCAVTRWEHAILSVQAVVDPGGLVTQESRENDSLYDVASCTP